MAVIAPNSEIYLIKCPIELDNLNQLSFANATAQHNYFNSLPKLALTNATFQRKDGTIRWPGSMEDILEYNYCMYRNKNHGNKWFYAFISNMAYMSDQMTAIKIKTDVWQTWQFDLTWKNTYVEREHVSDDHVGLHTIPEGLDTGEYICNDVIQYSYGNPDSVDNPEHSGEFMVCAQVTTLDFGNGNKFQSPTYNIVNSIPQGCWIIAWELVKGVGYGYGLIGAYDGAGKGNAIVSMFIVPKSIASHWNLYIGEGIWHNQDSYYYPADSTGATSIRGYDPTLGTQDTLRVAINTTLDGYTPKNGKMFVAPYNYFSISNNNGTDIEYYYENFDGAPNFACKGSFGQGCDVFLYPTNSKQTNALNKGDGWTEGMAGAKLPTLSWSSDYYLNWVARNGKNVAIQTGLQAAGWGAGIIGSMIGGATQNFGAYDMAEARIGWAQSDPRAQEREIEYLQNMPGSGSASGGAGLIGSVFNFASQVANTQNAIRSAKMVPPQAKGNISCADLAYTSGKSTRFTARKMSVRAEYARCIDNYFSMFGYKVNTMKIPNVTGRRNWNYVKTVGCNIIGDIPQGDLNEIKAIFNNGVTIWHNSATYLDYSQNNDIVS